jgi:hypothetical protein
VACASHADQGASSRDRYLTREPAYQGSKAIPFNGGCETWRRFLQRHEAAFRDKAYNILFCSQSSYSALDFSLSLEPITLFTLWQAKPVRLQNAVDYFASNIICTPCCNPSQSITKPQVLAQLNSTHSSANPGLVVPQASFTSMQSHPFVKASCKLPLTH